MAQGRGMTPDTPSKSKKYDEWEVRDAMHTIMRAQEHIKNKQLMGHVRKHAKEHAEKMHEESQRAARLAKSGKISEKQMAKLKGGADGGSKNIEHMDPIA
jgi:hypothetical protein